MTDKIKAAARKVSMSLQRHHAVSVFRDDEGKAHIVPGYQVELVAVYAEGARRADILDDLLYSEVQR